MRVLDGVAEIILILIRYNRHYQLIIMSYLLCKQRVNTEPQQSYPARNSWTDQRVAQIKKKYDTPKKIHEHHSRNKTLGEIHNSDIAVRTEGKDELGLKWQDIRRNGLSHQSLQKENIQLAKQQLTTHFNIARSTNKRQDQNSGPSHAKIDPFCMKSSHKSKFNRQTSHKNTQALEIQPNHAPQFIAEQRKRYSGIKIPRQEVHDRRISNIDKINSKIKKILQCIDQCEQNFNQQQKNILQDSRIRSNEKGNGSNEGKMSAEGNEIATPYDELLQTTIIDKQKIYYPCDQPVKIYRPLPNQESIWDSRRRTLQNSNHFEQYLTSYKNCLNEQQALNNRSKCVPRDEIEHKTPHYRTPSKREDTSLNSHKKHSLQKNDQIDAKMNRLQQKIVSLEQQKIHLNIEFKPFQFAHSPLKKSTGPDHTTLKATPNAVLKIRASQIRGEGTKNNYLFKHSEAKRSMNSFDENLDYKRNSIKQQSVLVTNMDDGHGSYKKKFSLSDLTKEKVDFQSSGRPIFISPFQKEIKIISHPKQNISNTIPQKPSFDNDQLRRKIGERMQERKRRMQVFQTQRAVPAIETKKLVKALAEQVRLDEELRNSKNWFRECHSYDKLQTLRRLLRNEGLDLSEQQIEEELGLTQEEIDPFFSFREENYNFKAVVTHYVQSKHHWDSAIVNQWDTDELIGKEQLASKLDCEQKGYIEIEDLVRLLNTQSKTFYRNRDLFLVYERLRQGSGRITIELLHHILGRRKDYL